MIKAPRLRPSKTQSWRKAAAAQPAVAAHRLFPVFAAIWFAALFGLGSLVASADALAALVLHLHLPAILPAAAPPLGMTARAVLGLGLAGLGGAIGLSIGLVLFVRAGGKLPNRPVRTVTVPVTRTEPDVTDEAPTRRRVPIVRSRDAHPDAPPRRPLVVTEDVLPYPTTMVDPEPMRPIAQDAPAADIDYLLVDASDMADLPPFLAAAMSAVQQHAAPVVIAPAEPIIVPALTEAAEPGPDHSEVEPAAIEPAVAQTSPVQASLPPLASLAAAAPKVALDALPLAGLGLVQLIERLALAIATRQAHRAAAAAAEPPAAEPPAADPVTDAVDLAMPLHRFDPLSMDPTGPLLRAKKSRPATAGEFAADADDDSADPVAGQSAQLHDPLAAVVQWADDHDAQELPARFLGQPAAVLAPADGHAEDDAPSVEHRYSSLADMPLPRPELVPYVAFDGQVPGPGQGTPAPVSDPVLQFPQRLSGGDAATASQPSNDADRALREALATLRQMSAQR